MQHYQTHGWVLIDALDELTKSRLPTFAEEIAALGNTNGVIRHDELTAAGPAIARAEHFVPTHAGATGVITQLEPIATLLLQEPAVLYKEKINFKQPGGAGFRAHQDARA